VFEQDALDSLAGSIESQGMLQPVLVRPSIAGQYEIVAGERRWRAAKLAGLATVPVVISERDDAEALEAALVENMAREDLNPVEEARAVAGLVEELGLTREDVGRRIGRSRVAVSNLLRLLDLPDDVLTLLEERKLSEGHGRALLSAPDHGDRRQLAHDAVAGGWSVRTTEERARAASGRGRPTVRTRTIHPDQQAAAEAISETLGRVLGTDIRVTPVSGGYRASFLVDSPDAAQELANRVPRDAKSSR
jgi:ParB family chromosome partitioning protein